MAIKLIKEGNFFIPKDGSNNILFVAPANDLSYSISKDRSFVNVFLKDGAHNKHENDRGFTVVVDDALDSDGNPFADQDAFYTWLNSNLGGDGSVSSTPASSGIPEDLILSMPNYLNEFDIQGVNSNSPVLIPAPGAGKAILVHGYIYQLKYGGVEPFGGVDPLKGIKITSASSVGSLSIMQTNVQATSDILADEGLSSPTQMHENEDVILYADSDVTGGAGNKVVLTLLYSIVSV